MPLEERRPRTRQPLAAGRIDPGAGKGAVRPCGRKLLALLALAALLSAGSGCTVMPITLPLEEAGAPGSHDGGRGDVGYGADGGVQDDAITIGGDGLLLPDAAPDAAGDAITSDAVAPDGAISEAGADIEPWPGDSGPAEAGLDLLGPELGTQDLQPE